MEAKLIKEAGGYDLYRIDEDGKRVTFASTQDYKQKLSLKNCEAIANGYDLDELANNLYPYHFGTQERIAYKKGFQKALFILGDKKFSEEQMLQAFLKGVSLQIDAHTFQQSLQQTEWDVEIVEKCLDPNCDGVNRKGECVTTGKPKLDAENCLILKRL